MTARHRLPARLTHQAIDDAIVHRRLDWAMETAAGLHLDPKARRFPRFYRERELPAPKKIALSDFR